MTADKAEPDATCGESWVADYGALPCDKPKGHAGMHRTYGSQGPITWIPLKPCKRHDWLSEPGFALRRECQQCHLKQQLVWWPNV